MIKDNMDFFAEPTLRKAVVDMRTYGIDDTTIAMIIQDIRHASVTYERARMERVHRENALGTLTVREIKDALEDIRVK